MIINEHREGLKLARLFMVLSSISPLFIIWAIKGNSLIADSYFLLFCGFMVIIPNLFLWWRIRTARKLHEKRTIVVGTSEDHRDHLLVYLFTLLLPFYSADFSTWRDFLSVLTAIGFIVFIFWHLNLHYMNILFSLKGYRIFTLYPPQDKNPLTGKSTFVLITPRVAVNNGEQLVVYRLSDTVFLEMDG